MTNPPIPLEFADLFWRELVPPEVVESCEIPHWVVVTAYRAYVAGRRAGRGLTDEEVMARKAN